MARFKINEIIDWEKDYWMMAGDSSHMPESEVMKGYAEEYEKKVEGGEWPNLPFECEAEDEDEALEKYAESLDGMGYIRPIEADIERMDEEE